jgi:predicted nucleotidyltransferase
MRDWPGREHVETLRQWPVLRAAVERIEARPELYAGALLIGSLSRGEGDAISDVDLIAVVHRGRWTEAWERRDELSPDVLATFDRLEGDKPRGGHGWLTHDFVKVECLISEPGGTRLAGNVVILSGEDSVTDGFERVPPLRREDVDAYAEKLRAEGTIDPVERAYGDLIALLRRELRQ